MPDAFHVPTQWFQTEDTRSLVPLATLTGLNGKTPAAALAITENASTGQVSYSDADQETAFPAAQNKTIAQLLNSGSTIAGHENPLFVRAPFDELETGILNGEEPVYLPNFLTNCLWNVKTWSLSASIGGVSISASIPAGTFGTAISSPERPYEGKRTSLATAGNYSDTQGDKSASVTFDLGGYNLGAATAPTVNFYQDQPHIPIPFITLLISWSDSEAEKSGSIRGVHNTPTPADCEEDENVTILGYPIYTIATGDDFNYEVTLEADEWWTSEDQWFS